MTVTHPITAILRLRTFCWTISLSETRCGSTSYATHVVTGMLPAHSSSVNDSRTVSTTAVQTAEHRINERKRTNDTPLEHWSILCGAGGLLSSSGVWSPKCIWADAAKTQAHRSQYICSERNSIVISKGSQLKQPSWMQRDPNNPKGRSWTLHVGVPHFQTHPRLPAGGIPGSFDGQPRWPGRSRIRRMARRMPMAMVKQIPQRRMRMAIRMAKPPGRPTADGRHRDGYLLGQCRAGRSAQPQLLQAHPASKT